MEKFRMADFHQDTLNPVLARILNKPELNHAEKRSQQLSRNGLLELDLIFSSVYRRIGEELKCSAKFGNPEIQKPIKDDHFKIIDYYKTTKDFNIIEKPEDLQLDSQDQINVVLHLECGDIITDPDVVAELYARGVRSIGPMYNHDNQIGGGAGGDKDRGLTILGGQIIDKMIELGMIVDVSHANQKTAKEILERVGQYEKIAATHTGFGQQGEIFRGKERFVTPQLLQEITKKGGVVGLNAAKPFFPTLDAYIEGMKKMSDLTGSVDNLAVATDFGGLDKEHLYADLDEIGKLSVIAEKLSEGNFTDEEIVKIMYGNIERIVKKL
ncbi:MAG: hypothetical protein HGA61_02635 [Candidatus Moranbacteria bacterium]|nr:hypothetical protein [Candidatus Moranbacteria bacterium]